MLVRVVEFLLFWARPVIRAASKNFVKNFPKSHASRLTLDFGLAKLLAFKGLRVDLGPFIECQSGSVLGLKRFARTIGNWGKTLA